MTNNLWRPTATLDSLKKRAAIIDSIRLFFAERKVLEVETPLLARHSVTDPTMEVLAADNPMGHQDAYFLQTSPEYAMKRLLAAGSGAIFQIGKAFRKGEKGSRHNPEFTMLEWYRPGFNLVQLMDEVEVLVNIALNKQQRFEKKSYRQLFQQHFAIDPHQVDCRDLKQIANDRLDVQMQSDNNDDWLNVLLAEIIEPTLGVEVPVFIYDYPVSQSALASVSCDSTGQPVAQRFELYNKGLELANGYFELTDAEVLQQRFQHECQTRQQLGLESRAEDEYLLAALVEGLPSCSGVAMGVDRLVMLATGAASINEVIAFPADRA